MTRPDRTHVSLLVAALALGATAYSAYTSHESLRVSERTQLVGLFNQFQEDYAAISARFPAALLEADFRPARGTDDYNRLENYWIFAYAEWYATTRLVGGANRDLWVNYYAPLQLNALEVPSLRYVLVDMIPTYGARRPDLRAFYQALQDMARAAGEPLPLPHATP